MNPRRCLTSIAVMAAGACAAIPVADSVIVDVNLAEMNLCGPRMGFSGILDHGTMYQELRRRGVEGPIVLSQFGWHFEFRVLPVGGGPSFVTEIVPLVAGVEHGLAIPSLTVPIGIRLPGGFEFGMGPSVAVGGTEQFFHSSVVVTLGQSFYFRGVGVPVNLAIVKGSGGYRATLLFGYAIVNEIWRRRARMTAEDNF